MQAITMITCAVPTLHNFRLWSFLGLLATTYTTWFLVGSAINHGPVRSTLSPSGCPLLCGVALQSSSYPNQLNFSMVCAGGFAHELPAFEHTQPYRHSRCVQVPKQTHKSHTSLENWFLGFTNILFAYGGHSISVYVPIPS